MRTAELFVLSLLALSVPSAAAAQTASSSAPGALVNYVIQPGDTCAVVARRIYGNPRRVDLVHQNNPQLGPSPHHLVPGQILRVPARATDAPAASGPDARLTFVRHDVQTYTPDAHTGRTNDPLQRGNRVNTLAASSAEVTFTDETQLQLGEQTLIVVFGDTSGTTRSGSVADTTLVNGALRARLGSLAGHRTVPIATDAARAEIGAGEVQVTVDAAHTTRVAVYRGESRVTAQRRTVQVPRGYGSRTDRGRPPNPPQLLPLAPTWVHAPPTLLLTRDPLATITADYAAGSGPGPAPAEWHVQIARDESFNDLLVDTRVPAHITHLEARNIEPGSLFVRVSAIDGDPFEGPPSTVSAIRLASVATSIGSNGRAQLTAPAGFVCGLDGAALAAIAGPIEYDAAVAHRLRCAMNTGGTNLAEIQIAASGLGALHATARLEQPDRAIARGRIIVHVERENGALLPEGVRVEPRVGDGIHVGPAERIVGASNEFAIPIEWTTAIRSPLRLVIDDTNAVEVPPLALPAPGVSAPLLREIDPRDRRVRFELGLHAGVGIGFTGLDIGPSLGLEAGLHRALGPGDVFASARGTYERHTREGSGALPCDPSGPAAPCIASNGGRYTYSQVQQEVAVSLLLGYRFLPWHSRVAPYVAFVASYVMQRVESTTFSLINSETENSYALGGLVGAQFRLGPGALFLEVAARYAPIRTLQTGDAQTSPLQSWLGYRLSF